MKLVARALGAVSFGVMFTSTVLLAAFYHLSVQQAEQDERQRRRTHQ